MKFLKDWTVGLLLGAICAGLWALADRVLFQVDTLHVYIAVACAFCAGYVTAR